MCSVSGSVMGNGPSNEPVLMEDSQWCAHDLQCTELSSPFVVALFTPISFPIPYALAATDFKGIFAFLGGSYGQEPLAVIESNETNPRLCKAMILYRRRVCRGCDYDLYHQIHYPSASESPGDTVVMTSRLGLLRVRGNFIICSERAGLSLTQIQVKAFGLDGGEPWERWWWQNKAEYARQQRSQGRIIPEDREPRDP